MAHSKAIFAAGCIWSTEAAFRQLQGVMGTRVGYTGVQKDVANKSDLAKVKALEVRFDSSKTTFGELLEVFWQAHDSTELQPAQDSPADTARSTIFYHDNDQRNEAIAAKIMLERSGRFEQGLVTEILPAAAFWPHDSVEEAARHSEGES